MTDPDQKPVISDDEVEAFGLAVQMNPSGWRGAYKQALSAFLSARVPEAKERIAVRTVDGIDWVESGPEMWNACRDAVLQGRSVGDK